MDNPSRSRRRTWIRLWVACWVLGIPASVVAFDLVQQRGISRFHDNQTVQGPLRLEAARQWSDGRVPLWNPYKRAGAPLLADVAGALYPPNALFAWARPETRHRTLDWLGALSGRGLDADPLGTQQRP